MKPPFVWYGGKASLASRLARLMPRHHTYLEPMAGSAAALFAKDPAPVEIINDLNPVAVNLMRVIRDQPREMLAHIPDAPTKQDWFTAQTAVWNATPGCEGSLSTTEQAKLAEYARVEDVRAGELTPAAAAAQAFVACCGAFNARLYGGRIGDTWPSKKMLAAMPSRKARILPASARLREVEIECTDGLRLIELHAADPDCLMLIDPPYLYAEDGGGSRTKRRTYGPGEPPDLEWHRRLLALLLDARAMVMVTSGDDGLYREMLGGWELAHRVGKSWANARHLVFLNEPAMGRL